MAEPIYRKRGRRYVEIGVYEDAYSHYPHGAHLVWSRPGGVLKHYSIEPADAAMLATADRMRDAMLEAMRKADPRASMHDVVDAGIKALIDATRNKT